MDHTHKACDDEGGRKKWKRIFTFICWPVKKNGTIYKGMTSNLVQRIGQHKFEKGSEFTAKYDVKKLVWYKECGTFENAVVWEKKLRRYPRQWKINLIEEANPQWLDLWDEITGFCENGLHGQAVQ